MRIKPSIQIKSAPETEPNHELRPQETGKRIRKSPAEARGSKKPVRIKDQSVLTGGKEGASRRKLGIVSEAKTAAGSSSRALRGLHEETLWPSRSSATAKGESPSKEGKRKSGSATWTVLYYGAGDCMEEEFQVRNLLRLQEAAGDPQFNLLAQIDRGETFHTVEKHGGKPGVTRYCLKPGDSPDRITSPEIEHLGALNSSRPEVFQDFLQWGMKNYPAQNYLIAVEGHGSGLGLLADLSPQAKQETHPTAGIAEFAQALKNAEKAAGVEKDRVLVDIGSCLMGNIETACELQDAASQLLVSQAPLVCMSFRPDLALDSPAGLQEMGYRLAELDARELKDKPQASTSALLDLNRIPELEKAVRDFKIAVQNSPKNQAALKQIIEVESRPNFAGDTAESFFASDLHTIAELAADEPKLQREARRLENAVDNAVLKFSRRESPDFNKNAHGLGVSTAHRPDFYRETGYGELAFDRATGWSDFMLTYAPGTALNSLKDSGIIPEEDETARVARLWMNSSTLWNREISKLNQRLQTNRQTAGLTSLEVNERNLSAIAAFPPLDGCQKSSGSQPMDKLLNSLISLSAARPEKAPEVLKTGLLIVAALKGEMQAENLAGAAQILLENREAIEPEIKFDLGAKMLRNLAKNARNDKAIAALNEGGRDSKKQLKALADLGKKKRSEAE